MLRKILKALKSALRAMARMLDGTLRAVFGGGGGDDIIVDDDHDFVAEEKAVQNAVSAPAMEEHDLIVERRRDAALVRVYAMTAVMTGERPVLPPCAARSIREWLPGLNAADLKLLAHANADDVYQHIGKGPYLQGVHRVQRLQPVALSMRSGPAIDDDEPRDVAGLRAAFGF